MTKKKILAWFATPFGMMVARGIGGVLASVFAISCAKFPALMHMLRLDMFTPDDVENVAIPFAIAVGAAAGLWQGRKTNKKIHKALMTPPPKVGVLPIMFLSLALLSGCRNIGSTYSTTTAVGNEVKTVAFSIHCYSLFWPSELSGAELVFPGATNTVPGKVVIGKYTSTGGAAELVPIFDAAGKWIGYAAKGAVEGVVK